MTRRRIPWPRSKVQPGPPQRVNAAHHDGWAPSFGALSKPAEWVPRHVVIVAPAYNGQPTRGMLNMPGSPPAPKGKHSYRGRMLNFGMIAGAEDDFMATQDDESHPNSFGIPPAGNVIPSPVMFPSAVGALSGPGVTQDRFRRQRPVRRLSALLPTVPNEWAPQRYGDNYDGERGYPGAEPGHSGHDGLQALLGHGGHPTGRHIMPGHSGAEAAPPAKRKAINVLPKLPARKPRKPKAHR